MDRSERERDRQIERERERDSHCRLYKSISVNKRVFQAKYACKSRRDTGVNLL